MSGADLDTRVRTQAFRFLTEQTRFHGEVVPRDIAHGRRVFFRDPPRVCSWSWWWAWPRPCPRGWLHWGAEPIRRGSLYPARSLPVPISPGAECEVYTASQRRPGSCGPRGDRRRTANARSAALLSARATRPSRAATCLLGTRRCHARCSWGDTSIRFHTCSLLGTSLASCSPATITKRRHAARFCDGGARR
jgi:hypothetical protein